MPITIGILSRPAEKMTDTEVFSFLHAKSKFRLAISPRIPRLSICVIILCTVLTLLPENIVGSCMTDGDCGADGVCERGSCICAAGWSGDVCDHCQGRTRLEESSGYIIEALDDYQDRRKCTWLVDGGRPGANIRFILQEFGTECSWDYLYIYDGDSIYAPLVASLNGPIIHDSVNIKHEIVTTSGFAYLYFYSDAAFSLDGFNISYSIESCPGNGCSGHGNCSSYHLNCTCEPLWLGEACNIPACPNNCSGLGYCDPTSNACVCQPGFKGRDCGTLVEDGLWEIKEGAISEGRGAASTILIGDDLWVVGGYTYNENSNLTVSRYNIPSGTSVVIDAQAEYGVMPRPRYSHSTDLYEDKFYMYGGSFFGSGITAELWSFHLPSQTWTNMTSGPYALEGHSAHIINDIMIVIFGYSPIYSYTNMVQEYNITSGRWSVVETRGAAVVGAYGHSSVYHQESGKIYIHGGFRLKTAMDHMLSDLTYQYDVNTKSWLILKQSNQPRFLHSAVILNGLMLVFGGNTHTDNTRPSGAKCYSKDFLAYNLECASWEQIEMSTGLHNEISRFAHSAFIYQESMWIYSGYNGLLSTSALLYVPGNCSVITNSSVCVEGLPGLWCVWDLVSETCVSANSVPELATNHSNCPIEVDPQCGMISSCQTCVEKPGCGFCNGNCSKNCQDEIGSQECDPATCSVFYNCRTCNSQNYCQWSNDKCQPSSSGGNTGSCKEPCSNFEDCSTCLGENSRNCMWCQSQQRCVDSTTYMTSFPFGLCLEWRTSVEKCPKICSDYQTCQECQGDPSCGWCDAGNRDGLGACMEGSYTGPINTDLDPIVDYGMCPAQRWYFVQCPSCQCNGHSTCPKNSSECGLCEDYTEGEKCDTCQLGYYGRPQNGGECNLCSCNDHSDICHQTTGNCYCDAKGVTGSNCDRCETNAKYYGNPVNGGYCYYKLLMNWQYTFNLSDEEDKNYTNIAMMTSPNSPNRDIEFILRVDRPVYLNITFTARDVEGEQPVIDGTYVETTYRQKLSRYDYDFTLEGNTTFYFYLSNFTTPLSFEVCSAMSQAEMQTESINVDMATDANTTEVWLPPYRRRSMFTLTVSVLSTIIFISCIGSVTRICCDMYRCRRPGSRICVQTTECVSQTPYPDHEYYPDDTTPQVFLVLFAVALVVMVFVILFSFGLCVGKFCFNFHIRRQEERVPLQYSGDFQDVLEALIVFVSCMVLLLGIMTFTWRIYQHLEIRRLRQVLYVDIQPDLLHYIAAALGAFIITLLLFFVGVRIQTCLVTRRDRQVIMLYPTLMFTLLQFLIVFFSCFLFFLLFFVLGWKFKQRCDAFRNRQVAQYHPLLNWVTVLVAFFVCFLSLLLIFLAGLKIKDRYDRHRRVTQRAVEMAVMASRPFAAVNVEVNKSAPPDLVAECQNYQVLAALEPCSDNKAGIMTVFLQLPMPDGEAPPLGQPRLALASALVQLKPKKTEMKEQRDRERDQRERERENRAREREQREREREQEQEIENQRRLQMPVAPLAVIPSDDALSVSMSSIRDDARHIRHHAEYDNPAMV